LRHVGCLDGDFLGCDSGGWYHLEHSQAAAMGSHRI